MSAGVYPEKRFNLGVTGKKGAGKAPGGANLVPSTPIREVFDNDHE
jgi:hypothetical protein